MVTAKEREVAFRKDLQELLDKHGALLTATVNGMILTEDNSEFYID